MAAIGGLSLTAMAEGYQVNTLSARQNGMGHVGTAMHLGAESMIFNPAGLVYMDGNVDFRGSFTAVLPSSVATVGGVRWENNRTVATPLSANIGMRVYDNLAVGVSFYTPYGSNIDWGANWPGAELNQRVKLSIYAVQPSVAWSPVKGLAIGGGLVMSWGSVDLSKGLVSGSSIDKVLAMTGSDYRFGNTVPASVRLTGNSDISVGVNIGAMYDINEKWTVGTSWRSQMTVKVRSGQADLTYANEIARTVLESRLNMLQDANFAASMPAAWVWNTGVSFKPIPELTLAFDAQMTGWHAYRKLDIVFASEQLKPYDQHITKDYKNAWTFKMGAQYAVTKRFRVRAGLMIDQTPVNDKYYNPETPGMTKISPSCGLSFSPLPSMSIDASVLYTAGLGADGECTYKDMLLQTDQTFAAHYKVRAWSPSVGVSLRF